MPGKLGVGKEHQYALSGRHYSSLPRRSDRPQQSSDEALHSDPAAGEPVKSMPNGKAFSDQPVASKIIALRAKLEADKAKRLR